VKGAVSADELRARLRGPLLRELRGGCQDRTVVGGLEKLLETVGQPFADVRALMAGYSGLSPEARAERLTQALALLESAPAAAPEPRGHPSSGATVAETSEKAADAVTAPFAASDLDETLESRRLDLGAQAPRKLAPLGLKTYRDLLFYYPKRYEDRRALPHFGALREQESATVVGTITGRKATKSRSGMVVTRAFLEDAYGGRLTAVWFNQPWLEKGLFPGQRVIVTGRVKRRGRLVELNVSHFEIDDDSESLSAGRIVGVYAATQGLSQAYLRRAVHRLLGALEVIPDHLPRSVVERFGLVPLDAALREVHFPNDAQGLAAALRRLKFDEFLFLELRVLLNRDTTLLGKRFAVKQRDLEAFEASLPFQLTGAQRRVLGEILNDMAAPKQMARLLQGDVGSGKTAVAAAAIYVAVQNGYQAALMAPTEILARQHYLNLLQYLYPLGVECDLFIGSAGSRERRAARERLSASQTDLAVGTHALIQEGVAFRNLGLAVIDEEHRFGVEQRRRLLSGNRDPDSALFGADLLRRPRAQRDRRAAAGAQGGADASGERR
jgi:ATP-dependent DNA helicase RecG